MTILDRLFPSRQVRRQVERQANKLLTRRFDAATGARRGFGLNSFGRTGTETMMARARMQGRSRHLYGNHGFIRNAVDNMVAAMVGAGIEPTGNPEAVAAWNVWAEAADAEGRTDVRGIVAEIARAMIVDGESFVQIIETEDGVKLRHIPAELVDESKTAELSNGGFVVSGVEFNADGVRVAYWILPAKPTDVFATTGVPIRVPASEVLHIFKPIGAGQVRGVSWLAPVILPANEFDKLVDALAMGAQVAAMFAGVITNTNAVGGDDPFDGESVPSLEPGSMVRLNGGWDMKFGQGHPPTEIAPLIKLSLRQLAAGLGVPEHMLSGDLSDANYSSLRAGLLPFRARIEQVQYHVLVPQLLNPIWQRVIGNAVIFGSLTADDYETNPAGYRAEWIMPAMMQVDPQKQVNADIAELKAGLTSRRKLVAARGWNITELDAELAAEGWKPEAKSNPESN